MKKQEKKAISINPEAFLQFQSEKLKLQNEKNNPDLSANDVVMQLIENTRILRELKSKGLVE